MDRHGIGMTSARTRERLINRLMLAGITEPRVLEAMRTVPRHLFIDEALASRAYEDTALPIGYGQTISQPYIVGLMTQALLTAGPLKKVLEVGTGCGYQAAILAELVDEVYSVERIEALLKAARRRLLRLGYGNIHLSLADGCLGRPDEAPFDGILVAAAAQQTPVELLLQLTPGGRMVIPVGGEVSQDLLLYTRTTKEFSCIKLETVNFVPLINESVEAGQN